MADFKIPGQPTALFKMPFADEGDKTIIPDSATLGRATIQQGFPRETQEPINIGGIAPNRLDFQGAFYMLSAFAFWQQSGGMFNYRSELNYSVPSVVYHGNILWWCERPNGPATSAGTVEPGTNALYWITFFEKLSQSQPEPGGTIPVGGMIMWPKITAPDGYFPCSGYTFDTVAYPKLFAFLGTDTTPDLRGYFLRGYDPTGLRDPSGTNRTILSAQSDAGINLTGSWASLVQYTTDITATGCIAQTTINVGENGSRNGAPETPHYTLDASRQWGAGKISSEFRPINKSILIIIKHD